MALLASGVVFRTSEVALRDKPAALLAASPKGTVPVLVLGNGTVIDESLDIMRWALGSNDPEGWLRREDAVLAATNDGAFKFHLDRYKYPDRHGTEAVVHRAAAVAILSALETRLARQANLCGEARGFADIAVMPFVRQFARVDPPWFKAQPLPLLQAWLARHMASPLFLAAMALPADA